MNVPAPSHCTHSKDLLYAERRSRREGLGVWTTIFSGTWKRWPRARECRTRGLGQEHPFRLRVGRESSGLFFLPPSHLSPVSLSAVAFPGPGIEQAGLQNGSGVGKGMENGNKRPKLFITVQ